jgi:hypothetical protein
MYEDLIKMYNVNPVFFSRYFLRNAERRYALQNLEFMLWRRGKFISPYIKSAVQHQFLLEEIEAFYNDSVINLPQIQFVVTTRCTLRCCNCNAFIPIFHTLRRHVDLTPDNFEYELNNLMMHVSSIRRFMLLGGEALISSDLPRILYIAASNKHIPVVEIVTNGTVLPSFETLCVAREFSHKVYFHISNYTHNRQLSEKLHVVELINLLKNNNIKHQMAGDVKWTEEPHFIGNPTDAETAVNVFDKCWLKRTLEVKNGKVAICPRASSAYELGILKCTDDEVINLREMAGLKKSIIDFYHKNYFEACCKCVRPESEVPPAIQLLQTGVDK